MEVGRYLGKKHSWRREQSVQRPWGRLCLVWEEHWGVGGWSGVREDRIEREEVRVRGARSCGTLNAISKTLTFTRKIMGRHQEATKQRNTQWYPMTCFKGLFWHLSWAQTSYQAKEEAGDKLGGFWMIQVGATGGIERDDEQVRSGWILDTLKMDPIRLNIFSDQCYQIKCKMGKKVRDIIFSMQFPPVHPTIFSNSISVHQGTRCTSFMSPSWLLPRGNY